MEKLFNIQLFAEAEEQPGEPAGGTEKQHNEPGTDPKAAPKYTDEDVDKLINRKFAEWQKQQEKSKAKDAEAARLAQMTAEEKANERIRLLEEKLAAADREKAVTAMAKQARAMLQDKGLSGVSDELLSCLIADDAETTKAAVESFISLFTAARDQAVKDALKGAAPKAGSAPAGMTKEQILAVTNRGERQRLMKENAHLF